MGEPSGGSFFHSDCETRWRAYWRKDPERARAVLLRVGRSFHATSTQGMFAAHAGVYEAIKDDPEAIACYGEEAFEQSRVYADVWRGIEEE